MKRDLSFLFTKKIIKPAASKHAKPLSKKKAKNAEPMPLNKLLSCLSECLTLSKRMRASWDIDSGIRALEKGRALAQEAGYPILETPMLFEMINFIVWLNYPQSLQRLTLRAIELNREIFGPSSTGLLLHLTTQIESLMNTKKKMSCEKYIQEALPLAIEKEAYSHELLFRHLLIDIYDKQKRFALSKEQEPRIEFLEDQLNSGEIPSFEEEMQRLEDMCFVEFEREYIRLFGLHPNDSSASALVSGLTPTPSLR